MVWCLTKNTDKFTFTLPIYVWILMITIFEVFQHSCCVSIYFSMHAIINERQIL
jgi:hypothetical protein